MVDRSHDVFTNREVAWKSDNEASIKDEPSKEKRETKQEEKD